MAYNYPYITKERQMKQYKKLYSFGCSFTEGGGLNNPEIRQILDNNPERKYSDKELRELSNYESYPGFLSRLLKCDFENYGTSRSGNELILNTAYNVISKLQDTKDILVTIQPSILSRMLLQLPYEQKQISLNGFTDLTGSIKNYYELYVCEFFNGDYACKKLLQEIEVYTSWFNRKNINVVWLPFEMDMNYCPKEKHFVDFDNKSLSEYAAYNKLLLTDIPNFPINDRHFSPHGNEVIAKKMYEHLEKYYG
jgi:hypothetical protein